MILWSIIVINRYCRTDIPEDDLDKIISSIHAQFHSSSALPLSSSSAAAAAASSTGADHAAVSTMTTIEDRRLRNLRKKLDQIEMLKERQQRGDTLEENQVSSEKIPVILAIIWPKNFFLKLLLVT